MKTFRNTIFYLLAFLVAFVPLTLAQGTYTQFDYPGAFQTFPLAINTAGYVVGTYTDASKKYHGFLLSGGIYTSIDYPNGGESGVYGINDLGQIVGQEFSGGLGFVYDIATQTFSTFSYPGATSTTPLSINNGGVIVGQMSYQGTMLGFEIAGAKTRVIGLVPGTGGSSARGISASGKIVGYLLGPFNFLFSGGKYRYLPLPGLEEAGVEGINPAGTALVGSYYLNGHRQGFIYENNIVQALDFPGSHVTDASAINSAGEVTGVFSDAGYNLHGFTWTPPGDAAKK